VIGCTPTTAEGRRGESLNWQKMMEILIKKEPDALSEEQSPRNHQQPALKIYVSCSSSPENQ
jgi:hypothetical protein